MGHSQIVQNILTKSPDLHLDKGDFSVDSLFFQQTNHGKEELHFNTFFNVFPARTWFENTPLRNFGVILSGTGKASVQVYAQLKNNSALLLGAECVTLRKELQQLRTCIELNSSYSHIYINVSIENGELENGAFVSLDDVPENTVGIRAVICTYKREEFAKRNAETVSKFIDTLPEPDVFKLIVVDNDGGFHLPPADNVRVVKNKHNVGGAGGFGRGMLEAYKDAATTHVLLMDDDIVFHEETLFRTLKLLQYSENSHLAVGGIMLNAEFPNLVNEWGATFNGHPLAQHQGLDIADAERFAGCAGKVENKYSAWTYFCYPAKEKPLPVPFFIRGDDAEFGIRKENNFDIVNVPGIAIWHHAFTKDSAFARYLSLRNELIINALHTEKAQIKNLRYFAVVIYFLLLYRYETAKLALDAIGDFLKGPALLESNDFYGMFSKYAHYPEHSDEKIATPFHQECFENSMKVKDAGKKSFKSILTLNHFVFSSKKAVHASSGNAEYHIQIPYRAKKVIYWNKDRTTGYVAKKSIRKFCKIILLTSLLLIKYTATCAFVNKKYKKAQNKLTSAAFWGKYLGM